MTKATELRDMGEEQIRLVWKDAAESLFRLRIQAQTEKLTSPSELRKHRLTIARCQTILAERGLLEGLRKSRRSGAPTAGHAAADAEASPRREKHARKHRASGRAKLRAPGKEGVSTKRHFKKRTQSGT